MKNIYVINSLKKLVLIISSFLSTIIISRYLGVQKRGEYAYIINTINILVSIFNFGIPFIFSNYVRAYGEKIYSIFVKIIISQFLVEYFVIALFIRSFSDTTIPIICILPVATLASQLSYISLSINIMANVVAVIIANIINVILSLIVLVIKDVNISYTLVIFFVKDAMIIIIILLKTRNSINIKEKIKFQQVCEIFKVGLIPMLTEMLIIVNYKMNIILMKWQDIDFKNIGIYSIGLSIAEYFWIVPDIFKEIVVNKTTKSDSIEYVAKIIRISTLIIILLMLVFIFLGKRLILIAFGKEYIESYVVTNILLFGIYSMIYTKMIGTLYRAQGKWKFFFYTLLLSSITNLLIGLIVNRRFGEIGASFATLVSYTIAGMFFYISFRNNNSKTKLFFSKSDFKEVMSLVKAFKK